MDISSMVSVAISFSICCATGHAIWQHLNCPTTFNQVQKVMKNKTVLKKIALNVDHVIVELHSFFSLIQVVMKLWITF